MIAGPCEVGTSVVQAAEVVRRGGVVAFPTETYYGMAVDPFNESALRRLFSLKHRDHSKPLLVLVDRPATLGNLISAPVPCYEPLMERHWPGPLTLVFPAASHLSPLLTGGSHTVGVRISPHPLATELVQKAGGAITATSANPAGKPPAVRASDVLSYFGREVDYVLDGGNAPGGLCSTVLAIRNGKPFLVRRGQIPINVDTL